MMEPGRWRALATKTRKRLTARCVLMERRIWPAAGPAADDIIEQAIDQAVREETQALRAALARQLSNMREFRDDCQCASCQADRALLGETKETT